MAGPDNYSGTFPGTLTFDGHRIECLINVRGTLCDTLEIWVPSDDSARIVLYQGVCLPWLREVLLS